MLLSPPVHTPVHAVYPPVYPTEAYPTKADLPTAASGGLLLPPPVHAVHPPVHTTDPPPVHTAAPPPPRLHTSDSLLERGLLLRTLVPPPVQSAKSLPEGGLSLPSSRGVPPQVHTAEALMARPPAVHTTGPPQVHTAEVSPTVHTVDTSGGPPAVDTAVGLGDGNTAVGPRAGPVRTAAPPPVHTVESLLEKLRVTRVMPIIDVPTAAASDAAVPLAKALYAGGVRAHRFCTYVYVWI